MPDRILLLDDDPVFASFAAKVATTAGYEVLELTDSTRFEDVVKSWQPTHILIDLNMPQIDGVEALQILARSRSAAMIVICSVAAQDFLDAIDRLGRRYGLRMSGVIQKPIRPQVFKTFLDGLATEREPDLSTGLAFDRGFFDEVCVAMGNEWAVNGLKVIINQSEQIFAAEYAESADRAQLARAAHALTSSAGLLGFSEFSQVCRQLEEACSKGGDLWVPVRLTQAASRSMCRKAREMIADLTQDSLNRSLGACSGGVQHDAGALS